MSVVCNYFFIIDWKRKTKENKIIFSAENENATFAVFGAESKKKNEIFYI